MFLEQPTMRPVARGLYALGETLDRETRFSTDSLLMLTNARRAMR